MGQRFPLLLLLLATVMAFISSACGNVRRIRRPEEDLNGGITRKAAPNPDDCELREVNGNCKLDIDGNFRVTATCPAAPPKEEEVARFSVCARDGAMKKFHTAACRAGGDTIVHLYSMTDSCFEEDWDVLSGASLAEIVVYKTR